MIEAINRVWEKVFDDSGENEVSGKVENCPGESCKQFSERFPKTKGRWKERAEEACAGCGRCDGKIPVQKKVKTDEVSEVLEEIHDIIHWENAGHKVAWEVYPFEFSLIHKYWRQAEFQVKELREIRMQNFLKGWMEQ